MNSDNLQPQDPVILSIAARIDHYIARVHEEYDKDPATFVDSITRQEAAIMNIVRAVAAALELGQHLLMEHKLRVPQSHEDVFDHIESADLIYMKLAYELNKLIRFRYAALHEYPDLQIAELEYLILHQLRFFSIFSNIE
jgi:uncharacterized protein YutE (UPF0331/DUF86 family)